MTNSEWVSNECGEIANMLYVEGCIVEGRDALAEMCGEAARRFDKAEAQKAEAVEYVLNRLRDAVHEHLAKEVPYRAFSGDPVEEEGRIGYCKGQQHLASVVLGSIEGIRHGDGIVKWEAEYEKCSEGAKGT